MHQSEKKGGQSGFAASRNCKVAFYFPRVRKRARTTIHAHDSFDPVTSLTLRHNRSFSLNDFEVRQLPQVRRGHDTVIENHGLAHREMFERFTHLTRSNGYDCPYLSATTVMIVVWVYQL